jgi:hypothetical protein
MTDGGGSITPSQRSAGSGGVPATIPADADTHRWILIRDTAVFCAKLAIDGLKDLVLFPMVLVALGLDLLRPGKKTGAVLHITLRAGWSFEQWLDLFEPARRESLTDVELDRAGADGLFDQIEERLRTQVAKGGLTASTKRALDGLLDSLEPGDPGGHDPRV